MPWVIQWGDNKVAMVIVTMARGWRTTVNVCSIWVKRIGGPRQPWWQETLHGLIVSHLPPIITVFVLFDCFLRWTEDLLQISGQFTCVREPVAGCKPWESPHHHFQSYLPFVGHRIPSHALALKGSIVKCPYINIAACEAIFFLNNCAWLVLTVLKHLVFLFYFMLHIHTPHTLQAKTVMKQYRTCFVGSCRNNSQSHESSQLNWNKVGPDHFI